MNFFLFFYYIIFLFVKELSDGFQSKISLSIYLCWVNKVEVIHLITYWHNLLENKCIVKGASGKNIRAKINSAIFFF